MVTLLFSDRFCHICVISLLTRQRQKVSKILLPLPHPLLHNTEDGLGQIGTDQDVLI